MPRIANDPIYGRSEMMQGLVQNSNGQAIAGIVAQFHGFQQGAALTWPSAPTTRTNCIDLAAWLYDLWDRHLASTAHLAADATNVKTGDTAVKADDRAEAIAFLNGIKALHNTGGHTDQAGVHHNDDGTNQITATDAVALGATAHDSTTTAIATADATTQATNIALCNAARTSYIAHIADALAHDAADATNTVTATAARDYSAAGVAHQDLTALVATADATTMDTCSALANALKTSYNTGGHCDGANVHSATDATNTITAANSVSTGATEIHLGQTALITTADATDYATARVLCNVLSASYIAHCADTTAHDNADAVNVITAVDPATSDNECNLLLTDLKVQVQAHDGQATVHYNADTITIAAANATTEGTAVALANELKADMNAHYIKSQEYTAVTLTNDLRTSVIAHATQATVHYLDDSTLAAFTTAAATDSTSAIALATALKAAINLHYQESSTYDCMLIANELKVDLVPHGILATAHATLDTITVTAPASTDLATSYTLINEIKGDLNTHYAKNVDDLLITLAADVLTQIEAHISEGLSYAVEGFEVIEVGG